MNYSEPSWWNEPEECKPQFFQDSEDSVIAPNCMECTETNCEHYERWNKNVKEKTNDSNNYRSKKEQK